MAASAHCTALEVRKSVSVALLQYLSCQPGKRQREVSGNIRLNDPLACRRMLMNDVSADTLFLFTIAGAFCLWNCSRILGHLRISESLRSSRTGPKPLIRSLAPTQRGLFGFRIRIKRSGSPPIHRQEIHQSAQQLHLLNFVQAPHLDSPLTVWQIAHPFGRSDQPVAKSITAWSDYRHR